jgi:two-component system, chemotaxis family, protein-glutamate methylesterase/glutaminase
VVHFPPHVTSVLPRILTRRGTLTAVHPRDGESIRRGCVYVAPPDRHLLVERGRVRLVRGPRENAARPAIDPLFRSAALAYGARVIAVVLTGNLDDGTAGLLAVHAAGGVAVVQDPEDALYAGMPSSALRHVPSAHSAPLAAIPSLLTTLVGEHVEEEESEAMGRENAQEVEIAAMDPQAIEAENPGQPSEYVCPECTGTLWEKSEGDLLRFRCRVGHAYSMETLLAEQESSLDAALWAAYRALEERAALVERMMERMQDRGQDSLAARYREQALEARDRAGVIRAVLLSGSVDVPASAAGSAEGNGAK